MNPYEPPKSDGEPFLYFSEYVRMVDEAISIRIRRMLIISFVVLLIVQIAWAILFGLFLEADRIDETIKRTITMTLGAIGQCATIYILFGRRNRKP